MADIWLPGDDPIALAVSGDYNNDPYYNPLRQEVDVRFNANHPLAEYVRDCTIIGPNGPVQLAPVGTTYVDWEESHASSSPTDWAFVNGEKGYAYRTRISASATSSTYRTLRSIYPSGSPYGFGSTDTKTVMVVGNKVRFTVGNAGSSSISNQGYYFIGTTVRFRNSATDRQQTIPANQKAILAARNGTSGIRVTTDGVYRGVLSTGSTTFASYAQDYLSSGSTWSESVGQFNYNGPGEVSLFVALNTNLSDAQAAMLTARPYDLVTVVPKAPLRIVVSSSSTNFSGIGINGTGAGTGQAGSVVADFNETGINGTATGTGQVGSVVADFNGTGINGTGAGTGQAGSLVADFNGTGINGIAAGTGQVGSISADFLGEGINGTASGTGQAGSIVYGFVASGINEVGSGLGQTGSISADFLGEGTNEVGAGAGQVGQLVSDFFGTGVNEVGSGSGQIGTITTSSFVNFSGIGVNGTGAGTGQQGSISATSSFVGEGQAGTSAGNGQQGSIVLDQNLIGTEGTGSGIGFAGLLTSDFVVEGLAEVGAGTSYAGTLVADFFGEGINQVGQGTGHGYNFVNSEIIEFDLSLDQVREFDLSVKRQVDKDLSVKRIFEINLET